MHAARTIVPGTAGAAPAAYPALGAHRLQRAATHLGWTPADVPETALNTFPMPHS